MATTPAFTSGATASVAENSTQAFYTATASDPQNDPVTITLAAGADAGNFALGAGGALRFNVPPNYDRPVDANADNVYEVTLRATAGGQATDLALRVTVTNDREGVNVTRVATGFGEDAVMTARARGENGVLVISQNGAMRQVDPVTGAAIEVANAFKPGETGRVLAVAHFNTYAVALLDIATRGVIARAVVLADSISQRTASGDGKADADLAPVPGGTARATLFLGGDGFLFGALGVNSDGQAQDAGSRHGKFYRIQVDAHCGASVGTMCVYAPELFGDGVHAPAGGGGYAGQSFLLDRGTDREEDVTYFNQDARPLDFGWPFREGTFARVANPPAAINGPSITYAHGDGFFDGRGMTGGVFYPGPIASLLNRVILTDQTGKIFAFPGSFLSDGILHDAREMENRTADFAPESGAIERPVAIVRDRSGRLFVLDGDGELFATN